MKIFIVVFMFLCTTACVNTPQTSESFRNHAVGKLELHVDRPLTETYDLMLNNAKRCNEKETHDTMPAGGLFVTINTTVRVDGTLFEDLGRAIVEVRVINIAANILLQVIDLQASSSGGTDIIVHRINNYKRWRAKTDAVRKWLDGDDSCK